MIEGIQLKVCGLTSLADAELAARSGADYLGFILYAKSPRYIESPNFAAIAPRLPDRHKVAVSVEPTLDELAEMKAAGYDYYQIHFRPESVTAARLGEWSDLVGADRLWLAPKLAPAVDVTAATRAAAKFVLLDTYHGEGFGGSGKTGDWSKFARHQTAHPDNRWILAGGLNPENIGEALRLSGARFVDVNSGVESAPGVKDESKLNAFVEELGRAALAGGAG